MADAQSSLAWLDYSEAERRRMNEVIGLFRDQGILDELGLGGRSEMPSPTSSTREPAPSRPEPAISYTRLAFSPQ